MMHGPMNVKKVFFTIEIYNDARSHDRQKKCFLLQKYIMMHGPMNVKKVFFTTEIYNDARSHDRQKKCFLL